MSRPQRLPPARQAVQIGLRRLIGNGSVEWIAGHRVLHQGIRQFQPGAREQGQIVAWAEFELANPQACPAPEQFGDRHHADPQAKPELLLGQPRQPQHGVPSRFDARWRHQDRRAVAAEHERVTRGQRHRLYALSAAVMQAAPTMLTSLYRPAWIALVEPTTSVSSTLQSIGTAA